MSIVAIIRCDSYDYGNVYASVKRGIDLLGGIEKFASPDERILLKPNLLVNVHPDQCITTHPSVFEAVAEIFKSTGARLSYGDGPGIIAPSLATKKTGIYKVADKLKLHLGNFHSDVETHFSSGKQNKVFKIVKAVYENDAVISLPKFKTHELTKITGCVKNQFGCLSFVQKRFFHVKLPHANEFSKMLLDLNQCIHPRLYIMDSIYGMEGNGPAAGDPVKLNVIALSADPIALDTVMCKIIGLHPSFVPTIYYGHQFGYGECQDHKIDLVGDNINLLINRDFKIERKRAEDYHKQTFSDKMIQSVIKKPVIVRKNCKKCGNCTIVCPTDPKAIQFSDQLRNSPPEIDYDKCIRCYCCYELCPERAINLEIPILTNII